MPPSMWSGFATSRAAAAINGGKSDRRQAAATFPRLFCARLSCSAGNQIDNIAAGRLGRRGLAFLSLQIRTALFGGDFPSDSSVAEGPARGPGSRDWGR